MGVFDTTKKIAIGDVAHNDVDAGNPIKLGGYAKATAPTAVSADGDRVNAWFDRYGRLVIDSDTMRALLPASIGQKAAAASLSVALASDMVSVDNGDPALHQIAMGATFQDLTNSPVSVLGADNAGWLRMTQQRELLVARRARWAYADATEVDLIADLTLSTTSAYQSFGAIAAGDLGGATLDTAPLYIRIPMLEQNAGCTIGIYHNLGVNLDVKLLADLTGHTSSASVQRPQIDTVVMASGVYAWFCTFQLADGANASMRWVPMLNMPMRFATLQLTPASNPASGQVILAVTR